MNHVIMANHMISLITSSTTDPRFIKLLLIFVCYVVCNVGIFVDF